MDAVKDVLHRVLGDRFLAGENPCCRRFGLVLLPFRRRELVAAIWTRGISCRDHRMALRTFLGRGLAIALLDRLHLDLVHRSVAQDVAVEIEDETILLAGVQAESATDHLVIETRRHRRTHERHAVDVGGVEAGGQHVHVDEILQLARTETGAPGTQTTYSRAVSFAVVAAALP